MPSVFDVGAAEEEPVRLGQRSYEPSDGLERNFNPADAYLLALPYSRGRVRLEREGTVLHDGIVRPGTVRVVGPGERSSMAARSRFEAVTLKVPRNAFEGIHQGDRTRAVHRASREVARLCPVLHSTLGLRGRRRDVVVEGLATALIGLLLERPAPFAGPGMSDSQFDLASAFAEERLRRGLHLEEWAAALGMEVKVFTRLFGARTGSSPYAWFMDRRIAESMRLLTNTDLTIVDVALAMGFASQSHFNDAFRRRTGMAPGAWRTHRSE